MQAEIRTKESFLERSDFLAERTGQSLRSLAPMLGLSVASLFGYRSGAIKISPKAWSKLEQAERTAGIGDHPPPPSAPVSATSAPPRFDGTDPVATRELLAVMERVAEALEGKQRAAEELLPVYERMAAALEQMVENGKNGNDAADGA